MAPGLVQAHSKYSPLGVTFVSLTTMPQASAKQFRDEFDIPWPSGFGAPVVTVAAFGAFNPLQPVKGYETVPTLFLIGPDGRVRWNDGQGRLSHEGSAAQRVQRLMQRLEMEIEQALADEAGRADSAGH